jgi:hypothetical protein
MDASDNSATYQRHMDAEHEKKVDFEEIEIHSQDLKMLMAETDRWWAETVEEGNQQVLVTSPFYPFVWR